MKRKLAVMLAVMLLLMTACGSKDSAEKVAGLWDGVNQETEESAEGNGETAEDSAEESAGEENAESDPEAAEEEEETVSDEFKSGTMEIADAEDLASFRDLVNGGEKAINAVLTADIDMSGVCSESIGSWEGISGYEGTFDGQGHVITNLYAVHSEGESMGLFVRCEEGSMICNLGVENSHIESWNNAGAIVAASDGTVENCWSNATVIGGEAGGIGGSVENLINCYNLGPIQGSGRVGGVVGWGHNVSGCYNEGSVEGDMEDDCVAGGIAGFMTYGDVIEDCYNKGTVAGQCAGGICGEAEEAYINRCSNYGDITAALSSGGIIGDARKMVVENCGNQGNMTGGGQDGGIVGYGYRINIYNCYNWGNITSENKWSHTYPAGILAYADGFSIANCYSIGNMNGTFPGGVHSNAANCDIEESIFYLEGCAPAYTSHCDDPSLNAVTEAQLTDGTLTSSLQSYAESSERELSGWKDGEKGPVLDWGE